MKIERFSRNWVMLLVAMFVVTVSMGTQAKAQLPGSPPYLQALTDLRMARAIIEADARPQNSNEKHHEIEEINGAIKEIKAAAIDDGKDLGYNPPPDAQGTSVSLHGAVRFLRKAHDDCFGAADMPSAIGMKIRALRHIDEAKDTLLRFMKESGTL